MNISTFARFSAAVFSFLAACTPETASAAVSLAPTEQPSFVVRSGGQDASMAKVLTIIGKCMNDFEKEAKEELWKREAEQEEKNAQARQDSHSEDFFYAFEQMRIQYGQDFFQKPADERDLIAVEAIKKFADYLESHGLEERFLPANTSNDTKNEDITHYHDPLTGDSLLSTRMDKSQPAGEQCINIATGKTVKTADLPKIKYTVEQQIKDVRWILRNILETTPANTDGSPPILGKMFYCESDGKSQFIGTTKMRIREGVWLIIQAIEDTQSPAPDGRQVSPKEKFDNLIKTLCDAANALPATISASGEKKGRKSTCVRGLRKVLSECLYHQHKAFSRKLSIDQMARKNAEIYAICPTNPQKGLGAGKLLHVLQTKEASFAGAATSMDLLQFASFPDILTTLRRISISEMCQIRNSIGEGPENLTSFNLLTRLMAATSVINQACMLAPTEDYSMLAQSFGAGKNEKACLEANPRLKRFGVFASADGSFDPDVGDLLGRDLCLAAHAKQVLRAFGLCPGTPGTDLVSHLQMLVRAAYGKLEATDPKDWEDTCFPAWDDATEMPLYARAQAGASIHPLARLIEEEGDAQIKEEIRVLEEMISDLPTAAGRLELLKPWVNNEAKARRLTYIRDSAFKDSYAIREERRIIAERTNQVQTQVARNDPRYGYTNNDIRAFHGIRRVQTRQGLPLNPAITALQSKIGEYPFAPATKEELVKIGPVLPTFATTDLSSDRHGEAHYRNIDLVLKDLALIADDPATGDLDILKTQAAFLKAEFERKRSGWHKYDFACQFLKLFKQLR